MNGVVVNKKRIRGGTPRVSASSMRVISSKIGWDEVGIGKVLRIILTAFLIPLLLIASVVIGYKGYRYLLTSHYFEISEVRVEGNNILKYKEILRLAGNIIHQNIFRIDLNTLCSRLKGNHWIRDAEAEKVLPRKIMIRIEERSPFALISFSEGGDTYLIDDSGIVFKKVKDGISDVSDVRGYDYSSLPLITVTGINPPLLGEGIRSNALSIGLNVLRDVQESTFLKDVGIKRIDITPGKGVTLFPKGGKEDNSIYRGLEIRLLVYHDSIDKREIEKRFSRLDTIIALLNKKGKEVRYVDLSFKDKVVVN